MVWLIACATSELPPPPVGTADTTVVDSSLPDTHDTVAPDPCAPDGHGSGLSVGEAACTDGRCAVPAGSSWMGSTEAADECPVHGVTLAGYAIDQTEVTRGAYQACVDAGACDEVPAVCDGAAAIWGDDEKWPADPDDMPAVCVSWTSAEAYCGSVGGRLPTEAEWERAARGDEGLRWPWGNLAPDCDIANFRFTSWYCAEGLVEVGRYGVPSPYGLVDVAGNAWEWVADSYSADAYQRTTATDPTGPTSDCILAEGATAGACTTRVIRGGAWNTTEFNTRTTARSFADPATVDRNIGFRCAYDG